MVKNLFSYWLTFDSKRFICRWRLLNSLCFRGARDSPNIKSSLACQLHGWARKQNLDFLEHDENIYDHQTFELLQFLWKAHSFNNQRIRSVGRKYAFGANPLYVKSQARYLLFCIGSNSDTESIMRAYMEAQSVVEIADLISMARMDTERRNSFYISVDWPIWLLRAGILWAKP